MNTGVDIVIFLVLGLLLAAAMQLVLTNFGVALGLSVLDWSATKAAESEPEKTSGVQGTPPIAHLAGFGVALSVSLVLFVASLLSTEFSQIVAPRQGVVFGLTLWAAYWVLLVWLGSTRLLELANAIWGTAIASIRPLISTLQQRLRSPSPDSTQIEPAQLQDLANEISQMADLRQRLPELLSHQREALIAELAERTDLSTSEAESVVSELDTHQDSVGRSLQSSTASGLLSGLDLPSWQQLVRQLLNQVDLSSFDVETLWHQLQSWQDDAPTRSLAGSNEVIRLDAEEYVRHTPHWSLQSEIIEAEFRDRIYDPDAAPDQVTKQLGKLSRTDFVNWLQARGDLATEKIDTIADQLSQVQQSVIEQVTARSASGDSSPDAWEDMEDKLLAYCRYTNLDLLTPESLTEKVETLRQESDLPPQPRSATQTHIDTAELTDVLSRRHGISPTQHQALTAALTDALRAGPSSSVESGSTWLEQVREPLVDYFQSIDWSTISLEDAKPEILSQLRSLDLRGEPDWQALSHHLQIPDDIKTDLLDWLQDTSQQVLNVPRRWAMRMGRSTQQVVQYLIRQLRHYLQFQDKSALHPEQIAQDVTDILKSVVAMLPNPADWESLSDLKELVDPAHLRAALEARQDMTVEQIQEVLGWFESAWQTTAQQVLTWTQALWSNAQDWLLTEASNLDAVRQQLVEQVAQAQQTMQAQAAQVKMDLQNQADAARQQVAIAAWWLFFSLVTSAGSAAAAGWLAAQY